MSVEDDERLLAWVNAVANTYVSIEIAYDNDELTEELLLEELLLDELVDELDVEELEEELELEELLLLILDELDEGGKSCHTHK